jgi:hypothetical protein
MLSSALLVAADWAIDNDTTAEKKLPQKVGHRLKAEIGLMERLS